MKNIIIIGGWSSQKSYFDKLTSLLETKYNVFYIDFNDINSDFDNKLINFINNNKLENIHIIAWSMGGLVTLSTYEKLKSKISSITFISSMAKFCKSPDHKIGWNKRIVGFMIDKLAKEPVDVLNDFNKKLLYNEDIFPFEVPQINNIKIENLQSGLNYLVEADFRDELINIECETLIIHGKNDTVSPLLQGEYLFENIKSSKKIVEIDECAHMPFYSHTKECYDAISKVLKGEF